MPVTVPHITSDGAEVEVIEGDGPIYQGFIPAEFFCDTIGDSASIEDWISWIAENAEVVSQTIVRKNTGGFINSRYTTFQGRGIR